MPRIFFLELYISLGLRRIISEIFLIESENFECKKFSVVFLVSTHALIS